MFIKFINARGGLNIVKVSINSKRESAFCNKKRQSDVQNKEMGVEYEKAGGVGFLGKINIIIL